MIFMIRTISNLTNHTTMHKTQLKPAANPAGRPTISSRTRSLLRHALVLGLLLIGCISINAQQYVFMRNNGSDYYYANGSTWSSNSTFSPSYVWSISNSVPSNNDRYLVISRSGWYNYTYTPSLSTTSSNTYTFTISDGNEVIYTNGNNNYYLPYNMGNLSTNTSANNRVIAYEVLTTEIPVGLSSFTINGTTSINATGTFNGYTHTNSKYYNQEYTNYYFNNTDHFVNSSNQLVNSPSTTTITSGYTWSLSDNATGYATVSSSTGAITVTAIPDQKTNITLYCSLTYNQQTITSSFSISLTKTGIDTSTKTVTLDDREDHSWSYYSDVSLPSQLRSLNPADVKITYYGNGTGTVQTDNNDTPSTWGENATGVKVGIDADVNTFVYHKTLERTNGSTAASVAAANGRCAYTTIPNPFSVRPTYDSDNKSKYRGFYKWRLKSFSGGSIYTASSGGTALQTGATIDAETEIFFAPTSEYGMEVEFEALWARAYVVTSNTTTGLNSSFTYERNFVFLSSNTTLSGNGLNNCPVTYTTLDPATGEGTKRTITIGTNGNNYLRCRANTKIENANIASYNSSTYLSAGSYSFITGRNVVGTINYLRGIHTSPGNNVSFNYTIRLESGTFKYISFTSGYEDTSGGTTSDDITCSGSSNYIKGVLGSDYDRALGDNSKLENTGTIIMGVAVTLSKQDVTKKTFDLTVKSGSFITYLGDDMGAAGAEESIYMGIANVSSSKAGARSITIEGGVIASIAGGIDAGNQSSNNGVQGLTVRMTGGLVKGSIYGGAATSPASGNRTMVITGGTVKGWLGAGCNGVVSANTTTGGQTYGASYVYFGGNAHCGGYSRPINGGHSGDVFAAGKGSGAAGDETSGQMSYGTNIAIADNCTIEHNVYGGGNYGYAMVSTNMYILGGTVEGGIYGGANQNEGPEVNITMTGGLVKKGLYGGSNSSGTVTGPVTMQINGGQVGTSSTSANIHGGGYGSATVVSGSIDLTIGESNAASGAIIYGDVYGGSALGKVNGTSANTDYHTNVTLNKGTIYGSLYGGALGDASTEANVYGPVQVKVYGGSVNKTSADGSGGVYGANNVKGAPQRSVTVDIYGTDKPESGYALYAVYGGGNKADYTYGNTYPKVTIHNCDNSIEYVYGGGNAAAVASTDVTIYGGDAIGNVFGGGNGTVQAANVTNDANLKIYGGTIHNVFGGSNSQGTIGGAINLTVESKAETQNGTACTMLIDSLYGGGNRAGSKPGNISIVCTGTNGYIDNVFGGANAADISGSITLNINGGNIGNVFGGNNSTGNITGTIAVTVGDDPNDCGIFQIKNVYGGGNLAPYNHSTNHPTVSIQSGKITEGVYGGGFGSSAVITGNPQVTVTGGTIGAVYGGGNAAAVTGNTVVSISNATVTGSVYGGGNAASISGTTSVSVSSGTIGTGIYGGCNEQGNVGSTATVNVSGGTIGTAQTPANIHGGGFGNATRVLGSVSVTLANTTVNGDVYGGSAEGKTNGNTSRTSGAETTVTMNSGTVTGSIYGGGLGTSQYAADVWGPVKLTINKGSTVGTNVYGGNNANGSPQVSIDVIVNGPTADEASTTPLNLNNVYGGGNEADVASGCTAPHVNIKGCGTVVNRAFGGGNAASVPGTNMEIHGGTFQKVFGGGNGERGVDYGADVNGNVVLNIYAGTITSVFGGSNENGSISGTMNVSIDAENGNTCDTKIVEIYGGGNMAAGKAGTITINNCDAVIDTLYGGAKAASVSNNIALNIVKGQIGSAFGGNNKSGTISGTITVNVNLDECASLGYVYGAGNQAPYTGNPTVNVNYGTVNSVYGGGKGAGAVVTGNPVVTIGDATAAHCAIVTENVYGGGDAAAVTGNTTVTYNDNNASSTVANLFGGGNAAGVSGTSTVTLTSGKVLTGIYGGCNASGTVGGAIALNINGGQVGTSANSKAYGIFGGGKGSATRTGDAVTVTIGTATNAQTYPTIYGDVYGGSAEGRVNDALTEITKVWLKKGVINGDLYGGGFGDNGANALVNGSVQVVVDGGTVTGSIFGCNNANGTPKGSVAVNINGSNATVVDGQGNKTYALQAVYGGGNLAHYDPADADNSYPTVTISGCETSINVVYGGGNAAAVPRTYVVINGGDINQVFAGGNGESGTPANVGYKNTDSIPSTDSYGPGTANAEIKGGTINEIYGGSNAKGTIRASGKLNITRPTNGTCNLIVRDLYGGGNRAAGAASEISIGCTGTNQGEGITNVYGGANAADVSGDISLTIKEGKIQNVYGGNNSTGSISGTITVNIDQKDNPCAWYVGNVYGGGKDAKYTNQGADYPLVNIKKGTVSGNVFGGGYGDSARVTANPHVYLIGGTVNGNIFGGGEAAPVTGNPLVTANYGQAANIYGGGLGNTAIVTGSPSVVINKTQDKTLTVTDVFGGGDAAEVQGNGGTNVTLTAGTVRNIYGGGNAASVTNSTVNINGGSVTTGVYGGCNTEGTVTGDIIVNVTHGTIGANGALANVHGGGYGNQTASNGDVSVTINGSDVIIWGDVYGGSALGNVNDSIVDLTSVTLTAGTIHGSLYGGGLGQKPGVNGAANNATSYAALVKGAVNVTVNGGTVSGAVFGANNANGTPKGTIAVVINGTAAHVYATESDPAVFALNAVYGGGNLADCEPTATVTINGTSSIKDVFGGGNAAAVSSTNVTINGGIIDRVFAGGNGHDAAANVTGSTVALVHGGTIRQLFGGGNEQGTISGSMSVTVDNEGGATERIDEVYGGGNLAPSGPGTVRILCGARDIGDVYGGANNADISGNIELNIQGGQINRVFGGNNTGSNITGSITVNIDVDPSCTTFSLDNVYGGGNQAAYSPTTRGSYPAVNIKRGTISGSVFGGGLGSPAVVHSNPTVNVTGGTILGNLYGGGDAASVDGSTHIDVLGGTVGTSANHSSIHGGGYGKDTNVSGDVTVNIGNSTSGTAMIYGDVYGGSALGSVNTDHSNGGAYDKTKVNLYNGTIDGNVYGGGLGNDTTAALVYGDVDVFQYGAVLIASYNDENLPSSGMIFGCNNINGTPKGHVRAIVLATTGTEGQQATSDSIKRASHNEADHTYEMSAVFGGGNHAAYVPDDTINGSTEVFIDGCGDVSIHSVYGGGNAASTPATDVKINGAYEIEYVFGGGNGAGRGNPGANVGYHAYDSTFAGADSASIAARRERYAYGSGKAKTEVYGGRIHKVFGGSNTLGNVREATVAMLDEVSTCELKLDGIYGGGKSAYMEGNAEIELGCIHGLDDIYGGAEAADVGSDIVLTLTSGHYNNVYGGNNLGGKILGSITVNVEQTGCLPIEIGTLYLGGNNAPYSVYGYDQNDHIIESGKRIYNEPVLNLKSFASIDTVFGGGKGAKAILAGNPTINVNVATGWVDGQYRGTGDSDSNHGYHGTPQILPNDGVIGQIFGGGNAAKVIGSTTINIGTQDSVSIESLEFLRNKLIAKNGPDTLGNIVRVELLDHNSKVKYTGVGGGNPTITRAVKQKVNGATVTGNVYGGGNEADVTGGTNIVVGRDGTPQPVPSQAPAPAVIQPQQQPAPQQTQPAAPQSNAATESQQTRTATPTRL